ncbi:MAG: efflux RND transporter periplasmic adaptor subunit [Deltaproteobacteria bacterium]|nr:efflux RND transporter periplasmic adaptor subunit [Deltaproteobacteria bacterium]
MAPNVQSQSSRVLDYLKGKRGLWMPLLAGFLVGGLFFGFSDGSSGSNNSSTSGAELHDHSKEEVWTCSMHPQIRQPGPGKCPLCGMDLIVIEKSSGDDEGSSKVVLSKRARTLAKLRTTLVSRQENSTSELRLLGRVEPNETTLKTVTAWTGGRIDKLHVNVTGQKIRRGQTIATLYSPEVFAAHQDLVATVAQVERMASGLESTQLAAKAALSSARERLRLLGVPDDELLRFENAKKSLRSVSIRTPFRGTIIERLATEGSYIKTGAPLYKVANLNTLWIQLDAYESDLPRLKVGQNVRVEVEAFKGEDFDGKLTFIDPTLSSKKRTARVRVEINNLDGRLRPGMFAHAVVEAEAEEGTLAPLVVPASAPLFTGRRALVYLETKRGEHWSYEPRTVRLGPRAGDCYPIVSGLNEGDVVVSRGAFAIDADLQIRGGPSMMSASEEDNEEVRVLTPAQLNAEQKKKLAPVVNSYLDVQRALAEDDVTLAQAAAKNTSAAIQKISFKQRDVRKTWRALQKPLLAHAQHVARSTSLEQARLGFESLSDEVALLLGALGNPLDKPLVQAHCQMAFGSKGASWVQEGETIDNAYFGASMRTCGSVEHMLAPGELLPKAIDDDGNRGENP